ncbi:unnamed protein product [Rotaria sp. Silwood1]|nr:unnamed protein product [Rotaria sp. Silwood1]
MMIIRLILKYQQHHHVIDEVKETLSTYRIDFREHNFIIIVGEINGSCIQPILTFVPYTEFRWRLIFGQIFALDIQICGPNLILIRDGAFSVQLNSVLPELSPIPRLKEFLSKYADDRGLTFEFTHITDRFRDRDFILPELQLPPPSFPISTTTIANPPSNRPLTSGNAPTPHLLHPVGTPGSSLNPLTPASVGPSSQSQQQANSPSQPIIAPSPGFMSTGSPLMMPTMGSPMPNNTPATQLTAPSPMGITTQSPGTIYEIPYISPAARPSGSTFPGSFLGPSPGTPANTTITSVATPLNIRSDDISNKQTSTLHSYNRHLYTKHYPVYMSQQTFFRMLFTPDGHQWSKFESFLASSVLVKHFARAVSDPYDSNNPTVRPVSNEQDTYRIEHLSLQIAFQFDINTATYRIHCTSLLDSSSQQQQQQQQSNFGWSPDELQTMEIFLNENFFPLSILSNSQNQITIPTMDILSLAASTQNRNTAMGAFEKMLSHIHPRVLRDLIKIIRLEQNSENHHLWRARWCLTIPQGNGFTQVGHPAIYCLPGQASIFLFQFTPRLNRNEFQMSNNINTSSFIVPLTHDATTNQTTLWDRIQKQPLMGNEHRYHHVMKILNGSRESTNKYECSLFPSIAELISCLPVLPIANYSS